MELKMKDKINGRLFKKDLPSKQMYAAHNQMNWAQSLMTDFPESEYSKQQMLKAIDMTVAALLDIDAILTFKRWS